MATSAHLCNHLPVVGLKWWDWVLVTPAAYGGIGNTEVGPGITVLGSCLVLLTWTCRWTPSGCPMAPFSCSHLGSWIPCPSESTESRADSQVLRAPWWERGAQKERGRAHIEQELVKILESALSVTASTDLGMEGSQAPVCVCARATRVSLSVCACVLHVVLCVCVHCAVRCTYM